MTTISGYLYIIRTSNGREFPYVPSFSVTKEGVQTRWETAQRRATNPRSKVPIALAEVTLTVTRQEVLV